MSDHGLTLAIHAIMRDKSGPNLRNEVAHGSASQELCESAHALYAWRLILQLVEETYAAAVVASGGAPEAAEHIATNAPQPAEPGRPED